MSETTSSSMEAPSPNPRVSLETLARNVRASVLEVLWRQWRAVDAEAAGKGRARALVDPEALVLMSLLLMKEERRLGDLLNGWASWNSDLLSVQRTKNLAAHYPDAAREKLAWFAKIALEQGKDTRWASVFRSKHDAAAAGVSLRKNKARTIRVRLSEPAALLLRLRLGFGVGTKADVLGYLLGIAGKWASIRDISSATVYTVAAIRRASEDMAAAHLIDSTPGQPITYRADPLAWRRVLALKGQPLWRNWHRRFAFAASFLAWTESSRDAVLSDYAVGVKGRELVEQHRSAFAPELLLASDRARPTDRTWFFGKVVGSLATSMRADV